MIGTHALLSAGVQFADLGLVVVDEQHRFGVEQRAALSAKAAARPHVLVMTATPIPRSVAMTVFGDLETVDPARDPGRPGRGEHRGRRRPAPAGLGAAGLAADRRGGRPGPAGVRGLPPDLDRRDADPRARPTTRRRPSRSRTCSPSCATDRWPGSGSRCCTASCPAEEKDAVMGRFVAGETDVLVATTVIEVGVDVPNASVMVICDADRFGISQLHQLRGRIGRGAHPGVCLLLTTAEPDSLARQRLDAVAATRDGFALAEIDLEQRREGDVLGASQSGVRSSLQLLRVLDDADLIGQARDLAERCIAADPELSRPGPGRHRDRDGDRGRRGVAGAHMTCDRMSRIIAGSAAAAGSAMPPGAGTRPTTDRVREALFSALAAWAGTAVRRPRRRWPDCPSATCTPARAPSVWRRPAAGGPGAAGGAATGGPLQLDPAQRRATSGWRSRSGSATSSAARGARRRTGVRHRLRRPAVRAGHARRSTASCADLVEHGWVSPDRPGRRRAVPPDAGRRVWPDAGHRDLDPGLR